MQASPKSSKSRPITYTPISYIPLVPDFINVILPNGSHLRSHYQVKNPLEIVTRYANGEDIVVNGCRNNIGNGWDGWQIQLTDRQAWNVSDRLEAGTWIRD